MAADTASSPEPAPQKMSRYRSVRRAQGQHPQQTSPPPQMPELEPPKDSGSGMRRSMSRYHRPTTAHATSSDASAEHLNTFAAPPLPEGAVSSVRHRALSSPHRPPHATSPHRSRTAKEPPAPADTRQRSQTAEESARLLLQKERDRQRLVKEKYEAEAYAKKAARQAEIDRLRSEEQEAARLQAQHAAEEAEVLRRQDDEKRMEKERGNRLRKARSQRLVRHKEGEDDARRPRDVERKARSEESVRKANVPPALSPPPHHHAAFGIFKRRKDGGLSTEETATPLRSRQTSSSAREPDIIKHGGGGANLGIDAPVSAVNAGDRFVTVVCSNRRCRLPVNPTTTPLDLIKSAATVINVPIDVRTAVLSELFVRVNISRPLRNFEYVREVMNSWDSDNQNELTILDSELDGVDQNLLLAYKVPNDRPAGMSCSIYYSSKPGKWSKRHMTLREDGQLVMTKNEKSKEFENICTLTDYDIYSLAREKLARVKPPKKICYAVKSMQKSNIFANESQYVHFFCTNDRAVASAFYEALQTWRSWHLKHEKGEGTKTKSVAQRNVAGSGEPSSTDPGHTRGESVGSHYQLGAFTSFLDMDDINKKLNNIQVHKPGEFPDDMPLAQLDPKNKNIKAILARNKSTRVKGQPAPTSRSGGLVAAARNTEGVTDLTNPKQNNNHPTPTTQSDAKQDAEEPFAATGLLGRKYTQRQRAVQDRDRSPNGPFTDTGLINGNMDRFNLAPPTDSGVHRNTSVRGNQHDGHRRRTSSDLQRSGSKRYPGMPEPLIDLTPKASIAPQYSKEGKGKGYTGPVGTGPLVGHATFTLPEEAIKIPSSTRPLPQHSKEGKGKGYTGPVGAGPLVEHATFTLPEEAIKIPSLTRTLPQHSKEGKGKGYTGPVGTGPLVEHATFTLPEEAIKVPASTNPFGSRPTTARLVSGGMEHMRSVKHRNEPLAAHVANNHNASSGNNFSASDSGDGAFTGGSLLDQTKFPLMDQGKPVGRGVMDGSKARKPMLDFGDEAVFKNSGLLAGVPDQIGGPIIDRSGR